MTAGAGIVHNIVKYEPDQQRYNHSVINKSNLSIVEQIAQALCQRSISDITGIVVAVYDLSQTTADRHGTQRADERRKFEFTNQNTVYQSHCQAGNEVDDDCQNRIYAVADQSGGNHRGHTENRSDGQVNVSGDTHDTLSDTYQQVRADGTCQVQQVSRFCEVRIHHSEDDHQDHYTGKCGNNGCHARNRHKLLK